jgi:hypothetical protein
MMELELMEGNPAAAWRNDAPPLPAIRTVMPTA